MPDHPAEGMPGHAAGSAGDPVSVHTWAEQRLGDLQPRQVQFVSARDGWLVPARPGSYFETHDGGQTWQQVWPVVSGE